MGRSTVKTDEKKPERDWEGTVRETEESRGPDHGTRSRESTSRRTTVCNGAEWSVNTTEKFPLDLAREKSSVTANAMSEVVYSTHCLLFYAVPLTLFERSEECLKNISNHHFLEETAAITVSCWICQFYGM